MRTLVAPNLLGIYGGYFGAGISIVMLSALGLFGLADILEMSALTSLFSLCINGVASGCNSNFTYGIAQSGGPRRL